MAGVGRSEFFAGKNVAKVSATIGALNFGAIVIMVNDSDNGTVNFLVKAGPAAAGMKFSGGSV